MGDELSIDDLDHVTGGAGNHTNGHHGGDGLGWLRHLVRGVLAPLGGVDTALKHESVHSS